MKINDNAVEVEKSAGLKARGFRIDTANIGIILKTLVSLYSDPVGSVCREITSNCFDAQRERDIIKTQFDEGDNLKWLSSREDIEIEYVESNELTGLDDAIIFRDFGIGISPERVDDVYSSYFSSTKRNTNDQIGGFGLGSKTPFSYRNEFYVITRFNGTEYVYLVHLSDKEGGPDLMSSRPTTELNGTQVVVPLKSKADLHLFRSALEKQLIYFDNVNYINLDIENNYLVYQTEHFLFRKDTTNHFNNSLHIVLGKVAYRLNFEALGIDEIKCPIAMKFNVGDLSVSVSREDLMYDEATVKKIKEKLMLVEEEVTQLLMRKYANIDDFTAFLQARNEITFSNHLRLDDTTVVPGIGELVDKERLKEQFKEFEGLPGIKIPMRLETVFREYEFILVSKSQNNKYHVGALKDWELLLNPDFEKYRVADKLERGINTFLVRTVGSFIAIKKYAAEENTDWAIARNLGLVVVIPDLVDEKLPSLPDDVKSKVDMYKKYIFDYMVKITESYKKVSESEEYKNKEQEIEEEYRAAEDRNYWRKLNEMIFVKKLPYRLGNYSLDTRSISFYQAEVYVRDIVNFKGIIIYGFSEDSDALKEAYSLFANYSGFQTSNGVKEKAVMFLKISRQNQKYFFNAVHVNEFLMSKHKQIERYVTFRMIEEANLPRIATYMEGVNDKIAHKMKLLKAYEDGFKNTKISLRGTESFIKELIEYAKQNGTYNKVAEQYIKEIQDYFKDAELLNLLDFHTAFHYPEKLQSSRDVVKDFLKLKHKRVNL